MTWFCSTHCSKLVYTVLWIINAVQVNWNLHGLVVIVLTKLMSSSFLGKVSTNIVDLSYHLALAPVTSVINLIGYFFNIAEAKKVN